MPRPKPIITLSRPEALRLILSLKRRNRTLVRNLEATRSALATQAALALANQPAIKIGDLNPLQTAQDQIINLRKQIAALTERLQPQLASERTGAELLNGFLAIKQLADTATDSPNIAALVTLMDATIVASGAMQAFRNVDHH